ncbi:unnamed protein product [Somion occarium]|uniref:Glucose receptor Git3 N-terminal domain-containing protein n=1 Tax=Somion occarium TaxID=3059160 RepID=A0ABP1DMQ3_9APHY
MADTSVILLPNGENFLLRVGYSNAEGGGVLALVIISCFSMIAVVGLLFAIALSAWNTRKSVNPNMFVRSHAAAYLISLLLCDLMQAIGSIMNAEWYMKNAVEFNTMCVAQGAIKHVADVGTAIWSLIIALHTFWILFLRLETRRYILIFTLVGGWSAVGTIVIAGPAALNTTHNGPFFGISGYWCWISEHYYVPRITLDYMFLFASALFSFVLYAMIFFRLRGNIQVKGGKLTIKRHCDIQLQGKESTDSSIISVAKMMLLYPVAYTIMILPIAICRFADWSGHEVPFAATIFSDSIFLLSGLVNVVLFTTTRRVLPPHSVIPRRFSRSSSTKSSSTGSSRTMVIDEDDDLEKFKYKAQSTYIDHHANWTGRETGMLKTVSSPDDDAGSTSSYPNQSTESLPYLAPVHMPAHMPVPHQLPHAPAKPSPNEDRFERISLDNASRGGSSSYWHSHDHEHPRDRPEPSSPIVATEQVALSYS